MKVMKGTETHSQSELEMDDGEAGGGVWGMGIGGYGLGAWRATDCT